MRQIYLFLLSAILFVGTASGQTVSATTYPYSSSSAVPLDDLSVGSTQLIAANTDDAASALTSIGFDYWYDGTRYTQFSASGNGYIRMGVGINAPGTATDYTNSLGSANQVPAIAPYWDDIFIGTNGSVRYKLSGVAPNRKLVIEWQNAQVPYLGAGNPGTANFQIWLFETTGVIEYVYGAGMTTNAGGATIGFNASSTLFASATLNATSTLSTVSYATANNANTLAITSGTAFVFTPLVPLAPGALSFSAVSTTAMTLGWTDNATNEVGYVIYRSTDGINYNFVVQQPANTTSSVQTGLTPGTTYYWKVMAVTEGGLSSASANSQATTATAGSITSNGTGGGLWSATSTWLGGVVPTSNDNVTISGGDVVTEDLSGAAAYSLHISGSLVYDAAAAHTLSVGSDVTIDAGSFLQSAATGTVTTHVLSIGGNLINNGTLDFSTNTNTAGANITFISPSNNSFSGTGTNNIRTLTINKGSSSANILELMPANFTVQGVSVETTVPLVNIAFLTLSNGTLKISGTFNLSARIFTVAAYSIPATAGFWLNNPNVIVTGQNASPTNNGMFRLTQGTYNIGTASGNSIGAGAGASFTIEGGSMNVAGRLLSNNAITYTQSAGTLTVATLGNASSQAGGFQLGSGGSVFNMSGGNIIIVQRNTTATSANRLDYYNAAGTHNITGGTVQFGSALTATNFDFRIYGYAPNVIVDNTTNPKVLTFGTTFKLAIIYGNLTINPGSSFANVATGELDVLGGTVTINPTANFTFAGGLVYMSGPSLINNGVLDGSVAASQLYWSGASTGAQTLSGTGTFTGALPTMSLDNIAGLTLNQANNLTVNRVNLFTGSIANSGKLNIGSGLASTAAIQIGNTTTPTAAGTFDAAPTFNPGTGGVTLLYLRTAGARSTGFEVPASRIISTLTIDENDATHPLTLTGGNLSISLGATPTFTFSNGLFNLGGNTLTLGFDGSTAALAGALTIATPSAAQYMYNGNFKRWISGTAGVRDFPMGTATAKKDASLNFTVVGTPGSLTARWSSTPPNFPNATPLTETGPITVDKAAQQGSWFLDAGDLLAGTTYDGTFTAYGSTDIIDYTKTVLIKRPTAGGDWTLNGTHVTTTGSNATPVLSRTGMSNFSEFAIGGQAVVVLPVSVEFFRGSKLAGANYLSWKVDCTSSPSLTLVLERSADGRRFTSIQNQVATSLRCLQDFSYTDNTSLAGMNYYRLKIITPDGAFRYSSIVALLNQDKGFDLVSLSPNPVRTTAVLTLTTVKGGTMNIVVTDLSGKTVQKQTVIVTAGNNPVNMDLSALSAGTYQITGISAEGEIKTTRFVKY